MKKHLYFVELTYPKASKLPVYFAEVEAVTQAEALLSAEAQARREGWKATPLKRTCRIVSREVEV